MKLKGKVLNASSEVRELVGKDGVKQQKKVTSVVLLGEIDDGVTPIYNCRSYDENVKLPKVGDSWVTPSIKRFECYGQSGVAEVLY